MEAAQERGLVKWGIIGLSLYAVYGALVCPCTPIFGCRFGVQLAAHGGALALFLFATRAKWLPAS